MSQQKDKYEYLNTPYTIHSLSHQKYYKFKTFKEACAFLGKFYEIKHPVYSKVWWQTLKYTVSPYTLYNSDILISDTLKHYVEKPLYLLISEQSRYFIYELSCNRNIMEDIIYYVNEKFVKIKTYGYLYRNSGRKRKNGRFLRHPKTYAEKKKFYDLKDYNKEVREDYGITIKNQNRRSAPMLPDSYDDYFIMYQKSWKKHRKTQYKT